MPKAVSFRDIKVGDSVTRSFAGRRVRMLVTEVKDDLLTAGLGWEFERDTGFEYDELCQSGTKYGRIISHLVKD